MNSACDVTTLSSLDAHQQEAVRALVSAATASDGVSPLNERALRIVAGEHPARHYIFYQGKQMYGYAQYERETHTVEIVVHPDRRRRGIGTCLACAIFEHHKDARFWAHGTLPVAQAWAAHLGLVPVRAMNKMRQKTASPVSEKALPQGIEIRSFVVGRDEDAVVQVNARSFSDHPEQGLWTRNDVLAREKEAWFDPNGLLLAEVFGQVVGFLWTKIHRPGEGHHTAVGEIYVIGVDPAVNGRGIGTALLHVGLNYLWQQPISSVVLYVEANSRAVNLYQRLGFEVSSQDTQYMRH